MKRLNSVATGLAVALLVPASVQTAQAQAPATPQAVGPYDPIGLRAGSYFIYPEISVGPEYDSNVGARDNNTDSDISAVVSTRIRGVSNFSRHALDLTFRHQSKFHYDETDDNYHDIGGTANGRLDITADSTLTGAIGFTRQHQNRDDADNQDNRDIGVINTPFVNAEYRHNFDRILVGFGAGFRRRDYEDQNSELDRNTYETNARLGYDVAPRINVFVNGGYQRRDFDDDDDDGRDQDSDQYFGGIGTELDLTDLITGEVFIGVQRIEFDDSDRDSEMGGAARVGLTWNVTQLTTITANARSNFVPTTVNQASTNRQTTAGIGVTHELLRNVNINGGFRYRNDDFQDDNRTDHTYYVEAGAEYLINRNFSLGAGYEFSTRDSDETNRDFDRHVVRLNLTARF